MSTPTIRPADYGIKCTLTTRNTYGLLGGGVYYDWTVSAHGKQLAGGTSTAWITSRDAMREAAVEAAEREQASGWW